MIIAADYYHRYIDLVKDKPLFPALKEGSKHMMKLMKGIPEEKWDFAYAKEKWTVKEVLMHLTDTERVMCYRALRFARNDKTPIPGFEQDDYIKAVDVAGRSPKSIIKEYKAVRKATLVFFKYLDDKALARTGIAGDNEVSVAALGYIIAGHEHHHATVLAEKYL